MYTWSGSVVINSMDFGNTKKETALGNVFYININCSLEYLACKMQSFSRISSGKKICYCKLTFFFLPLWCLLHCLSEGSVLTCLNLFSMFIFCAFVKEDFLSCHVILFFFILDLVPLKWRGPLERKTYIIDHEHA